MKRTVRMGFVNEGGGGLDRDGNTRGGEKEGFLLF